MNKYTELSDFEINLKVARIRLTDGNYGWCAHTGLVKRYVTDDKGLCMIYDPCNNPADAMSIIIENLISLMADMSEDRGSAWWCASDISNSFTSNYKSNPLRAAMEVFLMMRDKS